MKPSSKKNGKQSIYQSVHQEPSVESVAPPVKKKPMSRKARTRRMSREDETKDETIEDIHCAFGREEPTKNVVKQTVQKKSAKELAMMWVHATLSKGVAGIRAEFNKHPRTITPEMYAKMSIFTANAPKNRYKDVGCWDQTRVVVKGLPDPNGYIHASFVATPSNAKRFICAQAPLDTTCYEYWKMIIQEKSEVIIMLCNMVEKGAKKCAEYYPQNLNETKSFNEVKVTKTKEEWFEFSHQTHVKVRVSSLNVSTPDGTHQNVEHYHWIDWPDRGVPPADHAPLLLMYKIQFTKTPMVVHCSAGIGRTGSIVLIQTMMEMLQYSLPFDNMEELLLKLREQRVNSVQTEHQYLYVHMIMLGYFRALKYFDQETLHVYRAFRSEYKKAVIVGV